MDDLVRRSQKIANRLLAFDASTTAVGWAIMDGTIEQGVFLPSKTADWVDRILSIREWAEQVIQADDTVLYEIASAARGNMKVNRMLGAVEFVFRVTCRNAAAEFTPITTTQIATTGLHKDPEAAAVWIGQDLNAGTKKHRGDIADALAMIKFYTEQA